MSIVVEASDSWDYNTSANQTEAFTCPAGTNVLVVILVTYATGVGAEGWDLEADDISYELNALTSAITNSYTSTNRNRRVDVYYLLNPTTGSAEDLYYDPGQATKSLLVAIALSDCDTSDLIGVTHAADTDSTDIVESITTHEDNSILIAGVSCGANSDVELTNDANTTEVAYKDWEVNTYDPTCSAGYRIAGSAGAHDVGWTSNNTNSAAFAAAEFQASAGYTLTAAQASITLAGQTADLTASRLLTAAQATITLSDQAVDFIKGYALIAGKAFVTLTGINVTFTATKPTPTSRTLTISAQSRTLTPSAASRTHTPPLNGRTYTPPLLSRTLTPANQDRTMEI